jgi:hypothetical protein
MIEDQLAARGIVVSRKGCEPVHIISPSPDRPVFKFDDPTAAILPVRHLEPIFIQEVAYQLLAAYS